MAYYAIDAPAPAVQGCMVFVETPVFTGEAIGQSRQRTEMKKSEFEKLVQSVKQARDIAKGRRAASRAFEVESKSIKSLRARTRLSQLDFAALLGVEVGTLRNWEQGRREPTGPAKALLRAIQNDPDNVLRALAAD